MDFALIRDFDRTSFFADDPRGTAAVHQTIQGLIRDANSRGITVHDVIATGRPLDTLSVELDRIESDSPHRAHFAVVDTGAATYHRRGGDWQLDVEREAVLAATRFDSVQVLALLMGRLRDVFELLGVGVVDIEQMTRMSLKVGHHAYSSAHLPFNAALGIRVGLCPQTQQPGADHDDFGRLRQVLAEVVAELAADGVQAAVAVPHVEHHISHAFVGLTARGANKGDGVAHLLGTQDIAAERTLRVGDAPNDLPMMTHPALQHGFAMFVGPAPALREAADTGQIAKVLPTNADEKPVDQMIQGLKRWFNNHVFAQH